MQVFLDMSSQDLWSGQFFRTEITSKAGSFEVEHEVVTLELSEVFEVQAALGHWTD